ncbi:MAG: FIST C-terminal domain-containing protein [Clostridiales bacterium]|jgi:hypothetical protein|nr:FIST C-terminal domain-containing protein [Clostridiales bacterium]
MKCTTGSSVDVCAKTAGKAAAAKAKKGVTHAKLVFVYASAAYDLSALLDGVKEELPGVPIIGNTSFTGVVTPDGCITGDKGFAGLMLISGDKLDVGVCGLPKNGCARTAGRKAAEAAIENAGFTDAPDYFYMTAPPGEEELYLKGVSDIIGRRPMFGGSAADNGRACEGKIYTDSGVLPDGVAVAFFYVDKPMVHVFTGAYRETSDAGIITKIHGSRVLAEIDGEPALKKYAAWRGLNPDSLMGGALLEAAVTSPLGVKDILGGLTAIRHPINGSADYSMGIDANLAEKTAVIRMEASAEELIASASGALKALKEKMRGASAGFHLIHSGRRLGGAKDKLEELAKALKAEAGDIPFIMAFTFGEYGFQEDGANTTGGLMLSYTGYPA